MTKTKNGTNKTNKARPPNTGTERSRTWAPLVYPRSAVIPLKKPYGDKSPAPTKNKLNPFFPLHWAVLTAALREMLTLDKTLDNQTLSVTSNPCLFRDPSSNYVNANDTPGDLTNQTLSDQRISAPRYRGHLSGWEKIVDKVSFSRTSAKRKRKGKAYQQPKSFKINHTASAVACVEQQDAKAPSAEDLVRDLLSLSLDLMTSSSDGCSGLIDQGKEFRRPRKVSNADNSLSLEPQFAAFDPTIVRESDLSRYLEPWNNNVSLLPVSPDMPSFLEASIATESKLRELSLTLCSNIFRTVDTGTLSMFLGYRAPHRDRSKVLATVSDHIFDVSHAMFAWEQTELEVRDGSLSEEHVDSKVKETLFNARALRKVGGFEPSSLLPQAISTSRLAERGVSWQAFSRTEAGRATLAHHRLDTEQSLLVGQSRRNGSRRPVRAGSPQQKKAGPTAESNKYIKSKTCLDSAQDTELPLTKKSKSTQRVTVCIMRKATDNSWGVFLSKEGLRCVVARDTIDPSSSGQLYKGDVIIQATNEKGLTAPALRTRAEWTDAKSPDHFQGVVELFKMSLELSLDVERVCDTAVV